MKKRHSFPAFIVFLIANSLFRLHAQHHVGVDEFTGRPEAVIPLWSLTDKGITHPVSLVYSSSGVKVGEASGEVGLGWHLQAGGTITRQVRSVPDEAGGTDKTGWLTNHTHRRIGDFTPQYAGDPDQCDAGQSADYTFLEALGGFDPGPVTDTEPDIFSIAAPGLHVRFMFDNDGTLRTMPYRDIRIEPVYSHTGHRIESFIVTNEQGHRYFFADAVNASLKREPAPVPRSYFRYRYYADGYRSYYPALWHLTKITSPEGGEITFTYQSNRDADDVDEFGTKDLVVSWNTSVEDSVHLYFYDSATGYKKQLEYVTVHNAPRRKALATITTPSAKVTFKDVLYRLPLELDKDASYYNRSLVLKQPLLNWVSVSSVKDGKDYLLRQWVFDYRLARNAEDFSVSHIFLRELREVAGIAAKPPYRFEYYHAGFDSQGLGLENLSIVDLPKRHSHRKDYYGFYHKQNDTGVPLPRQYLYPEYDGHNRYRKDRIKAYGNDYLPLEGYPGDVDYRSVQSGMLRLIQTPEGAKTTVFYEPNDYYDSLAGTEVYGGGVRVKRLSTRDGTGAAPIREDRYDYRDDRGRSSGVPLHLPVYSFTNDVFVDVVNDTVMYPVSLGSSHAGRWKKLTVRSEDDLTGYAGPYTGYRQVTVVSGGQGRKESRFLAPVDYSVPDHTVWNSSPLGVARKQSNPGAGICHPVAPLQAYFGLFRTTDAQITHTGTLASQTYYDHAGQKVRETRHRYGYNTDHITIKALKLYRSSAGDLFDNVLTGETGFSEIPVYFYDRYPIPADAVFHRIHSTTVDYEGGRPAPSSVSYRYDTAPPYRLREETRTVPSGDVFRTTYTYAGDYALPGTPAPQGDMATALAALQARGTTALPVETIVYHTPAGKSENVVEASLTLYKVYGRDVLLPQQSLALRDRSGITDLTPASVDGGSATFVYDPRYEAVTTTAGVDTLHYRIAGTARKNKTFAGTLTGHEGIDKVCTIEGAPASQVAYHHFGSLRANRLSGGSFSFSAGLVLLPGRGQTLTTAGRVDAAALKFPASGPGKVLTATVSLPREADYLLSFWAAPAGSGSLSITYSDGSITRTAAVAVANTAQWTYYEQVLASRDMSGTLTLSVTGTDGLVIDDLLACPAHAAVTLTHFDAYRRPIGETRHDRTTHYAYDFFDRVTQVKDHDGHLLEKNTYRYPLGETGIMPVIRYADPPIVNRRATFLAGQDIPGASYYWAAELQLDGSMPAPAAYDYSQVPATTSASFDYTFTTMRRHTVYLKAVYNGQSYYGWLRNVTAKPANVDNDRLNYCIAGVTKRDLCGQQADRESTCLSDYGRTADGATVVTIDDGGLSGNLEYRWDVFQTLTTQDIDGVGITEDYHPIETYDETGIVRWNTADQWATSKQAKVITDYTTDTYLIGYIRWNGSHIGHTPIIRAVNVYKSEEGCITE